MENIIDNRKNETRTAFTNRSQSACSAFPIWSVPLKAGSVNVHWCFVCVALAIIGAFKSNICFCIRSTWLWFLISGVTCATALMAVLIGHKTRRFCGSSMCSSYLLLRPWPRHVLALVHSNKYHELPWVSPLVRRYQSRKPVHGLWTQNFMTLSSHEIWWCSCSILCFLVYDLPWPNDHGT